MDNLNPKHQSKAVCPKLRKIDGSLYGVAIPYKTLGINPTAPTRKEYCVKHQLFHGQKYASCQSTPFTEKQTAPARKEGWEGTIKTMLIEALADSATQAKIRPFGKDMSDITVKWHKKFIKKISKLLLQQKRETREELIGEMSDWAINESSDIEIPLGELLTYISTLKK